MKGNMPVTPASTTTYTIATNKYGTTTAQAQVIIRGNAKTASGAPQTYNLPVVTVLKVEPANIVSGQTAMLDLGSSKLFRRYYQSGFEHNIAKRVQGSQPDFYDHLSTHRKQCPREYNRNDNPYRLRRATERGNPCNKLFHRYTIRYKERRIGHPFLEVNRRVIGIG